VAAPTRPSAAASSVLLVEDNDAVRRIVRRTLERARFRVVEAQSGDEALLIMNQDDGFAAVITDMMMPGTGGGAVAETLRATYPTLAIVCMSGYTESMLGNDRKLASGAQFLSKPFTSDQLLEALYAALDAAALGAFS
jgi:CheY-like chemotaxis protein